MAKSFANQRLSCHFCSKYVNKNNMFFFVQMMIIFFVVVPIHKVSPFDLECAQKDSCSCTENLVPLDPTIQNPEMYGSDFCSTDPNSVMPTCCSFENLRYYCKMKAVGDNTNDCFIQCKGDNTCQYMNLLCPEGVNCRLNCKGKGSCYGSKLYVYESFKDEPNNDRILRFNANFVKEIDDLGSNPHVAPPPKITIGFLNGIQTKTGDVGNDNFYSDETRRKYQYWKGGWSTGTEEKDEIDRRKARYITQSTRLAKINPGSDVPSNIMVAGSKGGFTIDSPKYGTSPLEFTVSTENKCTVHNINGWSKQFQLKCKDQLATDVATQKRIKMRYYDVCLHYRNKHNTGYTEGTSNLQVFGDADGCTSMYSFFYYDTWNKELKTLKKDEEVCLTFDNSGNEIKLMGCGYDYTEWLYNFRTGQLRCRAGTEMEPYEIKNTGSCATDNIINHAAHCGIASLHHTQKDISIYLQQMKILESTIHPPGCVVIGGRAVFNRNLTSETKCGETKNCICRRKDPCKPCEVNFFKANNDVKKCEACPIVNGKKMVTYGLKGQTACSLPCNPGNAPSYSDVKSPNKFSGSNSALFEAKYNTISRKFNLQWKDGGSTSTIDYISELPVTHTCQKYISSKAECELAARANFKVDKNYGFEPNPKSETVRITTYYKEEISFILDKYSPPGCYFDTTKNKYVYNSYYDEALKRNQKIPVEFTRGKMDVRSSSTSYFTNLCNTDKKCICKPTKQTLQCTNASTSMCPIQPTCSPCPKNTFSEGKGTFCQPCKDTETSKPGSSFCESLVYQKIMKDLTAQKEKQNDLSIKNSRLWAKEQIRMQNDKLMAARKDKDNKNEKEYCQDERKHGTVIFPAIELSQEIEKIEDTTCIDTNRDELLKSFCSFTSDLENLFKIKHITKNTKSFWPNICCKERRDKTLEVCEDPTGNIKREDIIPFALSQGGDYSRHNLYVEVTDTIKRNGYLHEGMKKLIDFLPGINKERKKNAIILINDFFHSVTLCGPRIVISPGNDKTKFCELFVPYQHSMNQIYELISSFYILSPTEADIQPQAFIEENKLLGDIKVTPHSSSPTPLVNGDVQHVLKANTVSKVEMKKELQKRQIRLGGESGTNNLDSIMQTKSKPSKDDEKCHGGSYFGPTELKQKKELFCLGWNHLDLSNTNIKNMAIQYIENDIKYSDVQMLSLTHTVRYDVIDTSCPSKLFNPEDVFIQQVNMDPLGNETEWVAVVNLNTKTSEKNYFQSELQHCKDRDYLIGASLKIKAYVDDTNCCEGLVDYKECKKISGCEAKLRKLKDKKHKHFSKDVKLTGTQYTVKSSHVSRRRRLLSRRDSGC